MRKQKNKSLSNEVCRYRLNQRPGQRPPLTTRTRTKSKSILYCWLIVPTLSGVDNLSNVVVFFFKGKTHKKLKNS